MLLLEYLWGHWIFIAFLAPFFWSLVNIIDIYFVSGVYEDEWDGLMINAFFQLLPWLLPLFGLVVYSYHGSLVTSIAFLAGSGLVISYYFYFKTLFVSSDMVVLQALWNVSVPLVPFLAWFFIGEKLSLIHYSGIFLAFIGAMIFTLHEKVKERQLKKVFTLMSGGVFFLSLSMVLQGWVYAHVPGDFWTGFLLFSLGATVTGFALSFFDPWSLRKRLGHLVEISRKYLFIFVVAEVLNLLGVVATQRAIDLSPTVSFVAVIGSLSPIFVMVLSLLLVPVFLFLNQDKAHRMYKEQLVAFKTKILACCIIALGIYLIS